MVIPGRVSAIVVDYHSGASLEACVRSLWDNGVHEVIVVDTAEAGTSAAALGAQPATVLQTGLNLGYGRGANRGVARATGEFLVISNPDVLAHPGVVAGLVHVLGSRAGVGVVAPRIERPDGTVYPSQRVFPNVWLAAAHALLAPLWPHNPATRRYRSPRPDGTVDWVSGAFFAMRRADFEAIGGFDERFFMFAEDMDLCWRVRELGLSVEALNDVAVTHVEGLSRRRAGRAMLVAHHASALRFEAYHARGPRRALIPLAALVLGARLLISLARGAHETEN